MRVGIDAFPVQQRYGGIGCYVRNLLFAFDDLGPEEELLAYVPKGFSSRWNSVRRVESSRWEMPWRTWYDSLDVYHGTNFKLQARGRRGSVLTIHDLWLDRHPEYSKKLFGQAFSARRTCLRAWKADQVIAVSRYTAEEIRDLYGIPQDRISVIYHGTSPEFFPDRDKPKFGAIGNRLGLGLAPYILFVGGADPRKNHQALFRAFSCEPTLSKNYCLVIVGNPNNRFGNLLESDQANKLRHHVVCAGAVSTEELRLLYSHASLFVFPSRYEGFGIPVLEAMACGVPVVTSNSTALPEIAGDAAGFVNPDDPEELANEMRRILEDTGLQNLMRERGFERVKRFTWRQAAEQTLEVYRKVGSML